MIMAINFVTFHVFVCVQSVRHSANAAGISAEESGSDYGDWENDDWSVDSFSSPNMMNKASTSKPKESTEVARMISLNLVCHSQVHCTLSKQKS